jgi:hypothetical protein
VPQEYTGQVVTCPACRHDIKVPGSTRSTSVIAGKAEASVFFDANRIRWRRVRNVFWLLGLMVLVLLVCLGISITINPLLPSLGLHAAGNRPGGRPLAPPILAYPAPTNGAAGAATNRSPKTGVTPARPETLPGSTNTEWPARPLAMAFAVTWDSLALHSLQENLDSLDVVIPEWLKLTTDGKIKPPTLTPPQQEFSRLLRAAPNGPKLVPLLANSEARGRLGNDTGRLLASGTSRNGIGDELLQYAQSFPVDGFCLDFQGLPPEQLPNYACFIEELAPRLHAAHKVLYVCASLEFPPWLSRRWPRRRTC